MNIETGEIKDLTKLTEEELKKYVRVNESDMTAKQKRQRKVSVSDRRSRLGRLRTKLARRKIGRNELCPCMSGRKFKKCHGGMHRHR